MSIKYFSKIIALAAAAASMLSCSESMEKVADRIFAIAREQVVQMDGRLAPNTSPRTFENGQALDAGIKAWTSGFFPGTAWYVYEYTGDEKVREVAERRTRELATLPAFNVGHDIGFMINCSYGNAFRITRDSTFLPVIEAGAANLAARFNPTVGCTQSWGQFKNSRFTVIIDNMMNLELLTTADCLFGADSLRQIAISHATTTMENHFRDDYTTWHLVCYNPDSGDVDFKCTHQGYSDDSAWARGQAWALYGFTMIYHETGTEEFLDQAENIARMLFGRLPEDGIPYWDFDDPDIPDTVRDASAAAIMASAFAELSGLTKDSDLACSCRRMAEKQVRTLASDQYLARSGNGNFLLRHGVGNKPGGAEIDVPLTYADYYFLEALMRLTRQDKKN